MKLPALIATAVLGAALAGCAVPPPAPQVLIGEHARAAVEDHFFFGGHRTDGTPMRWCRNELRVRVDRDTLPAGAGDTIGEAFAIVSAATGISFVETAPGVSGDVQISGRNLAPTLLGLTGNLSTPDRQTRTFSSISLNTEFGGDSRWLSVVIHELGHALGLAHNDIDEHSIMGAARAEHTLTDGDLRGFRALGEPCLPQTLN